MDITKDWVKTSGQKGTVTERREWKIGEAAYKADGRAVVFDPSGIERKIATILAGRYGKQVELMPRINYPQGIQMPDYLIDGERFDLKSPTGTGKNVLYDMVAKKKKQSSNFIFDLTDCPLSMAEAEQQVDGILHSRHTRFVEKIVLMKEGEVAKVYARP